ncbi:MAG: hypothetical protein JSU77_06445 [Fidelibacterota bacterium]|nr:MAG: hypothetical protein JSU77_06445 [Candidatus Neomarinimicrobiota bacterium]
MTNTIRLALITLLSISTTSATIINVPANIDSIQGGINLASNGDTVLVHPGTYVENINFRGKNIVAVSLLSATYETPFISQSVFDVDSNGLKVVSRGLEYIMRSNR